MEPFSRQGFVKNHRRPLEPLAQVRGLIEALTPIYEKDGAGPLSSRRAALVRLARRLENRLEWGPAAPLIAAVLGPTGTGKSKVFNSLVKANISPSGFKRPTTMAPVLYLAGPLREQTMEPGFMPGYEKKEAAPGEALFHHEQKRDLVLIPAEDPDWDHLILIDTPDFDSVLEDNRAEARDVFDRCDTVIFVTDTVKYADQAAWNYLELIRSRGKAAVLVVNRVKNPLSLDDFARRLDRAGLDRPVLSLPDQPQLQDADLFASDDQAVTDLAKRLAQWSGPGREDILVREAGTDWAEFRSGLQDDLLPALGRASQELESMRAGLGAAVRETQDDLAQSLTVSISGELKNSLITQIQDLFLRWDILRYPRRLMTMPFSLLKDKVLAPLGLIKGSPGQTALDQEIDRLFEANRESLVSLTHDYNRRAGEIFIAGPVGRGLAARPEFGGLAFSAGQARKHYSRIRTELEKWVQGQAEELARSLNLGEKMTFYLAQVVSLGLFISIQVHTGGGFSFFDGLLDSALAPIMSKITGSALSRDKVKAFETEAVRLHLDLSRKFFEDQAQAYLDFLAESEQGLSAAESLGQAAADLDRAFESLK